MKDYLKIIKKRLQDIWKKVLSVFTRFGLSFKKTFKKPTPYILFSLFISSLVFSEIAYSRNSVNLAYGFANYCQDTIISEHYDVVAFGARPVEPNDSKNFNRYSTVCRNINNAYYKQAVSFTKTVDEDGADLAFDVTVPFVDEVVEHITLGTFFDYRGESRDRNYLATIRLEIMDKSNDNIDWLNFPFEGKDASSYIPLSLAETIVSKSDGFYDNVFDLIGSKYSIELGEKKYNLSINNIYRTDTYLGPYFKATVGEPIITDLKAISSEYYSRLLIGSCSDAISIVGIQNYLGSIFEDGDSYDLYLSSVQGKKKALNTPYDFNETIKEISSNSMSNVFKTLFIFLTFFVFVIQIVVCYWFYRKHRLIWFDFIPSLVIEEVVFLILYSIFYFSLRTTIRVYIWCNLLTMIVGVLSPILLFFILMLLCRRVEND